MTDHPIDSVDTRAISGPAGRLEIQVDRPARPAPEGERVVVICHPHPQMGGTMDNKVVTTLARAATDLGWSAVRFNFRGVGASVGAFDHGEGEREDARAVLAWAARQWPGNPPALAGFYVLRRLGGAATGLGSARFALVDGRAAGGSMG